MEVYAWTTILSPLLAAAIILIFGKRWLGKASPYLALLGSLISFISISILYSYLWKEGARELSYLWFSWGEIKFNFGFTIDGLSILTALTVAFLVFFIEMYSIGYMEEDPGFTRFFGILSFFTFSMLGLVFSHNYLQMYMFWELVGFCSYLLIGFWFEKESAVRAMKKAFFVTRLGDIGFLFGIFLLWSIAGTLQFTPLFSYSFSKGALALASLLIFAGAVGKSAQFPLHIWLPDAMEGPTPVSALLHSATMVAAGVYLVGRSYPLFSQSETALQVVAIIGAISCFLGASLAIAERNIKRILAYSTISQLGYMMIGLGVGTLVGGIFHFFTHAFFKALLFLCAGSIIHAFHTQDIREMGGALDSMPVTGITCLVGSLALAGLFPTAGFFSKDEIIAKAFESGNIAIGVVAMGVVFMTAFYIFRLFFSVFVGAKEKEVHEPSVFMQFPQLILALMALLAGLAGTSLTGHLIEKLLGPEPKESIVWVPWLATGLIILGIALAWAFTLGKWEEKIEESGGWLLLKRGFFIEDLYRGVFLSPAPVFKVVFRGIERGVIDGLVNFVALLCVGIGRFFSFWQSGKAKTYISLSLLGLLIMVIIVIWRF
jgi:NADH-quinone oxidoreductase subunit L